MNTRVPPDAVEIEAPSRLHLGVLDLRGSLGRRFGGLGVAIPTPSLLLEARRGDAVQAAGEESARVTAFAEAALAHWGIRGGVALHLHRAIPAHSGLGSGTQLGLAVARAIAELYGIPATPPELAAASGRGRPQRHRDLGVRARGLHPGGSGAGRAMRRSPPCWCATRCRPRGAMCWRFRKARPA